MKAEENSSKGKQGTKSPVQFSLHKYFSSQSSAKSNKSGVQTPKNLSQNTPNSQETNGKENTTPSQQTTPVQWESTPNRRETTPERRETTPRRGLSPMTEEMRLRMSDSSFTFGAPRVMLNSEDQNEFTFGFDKKAKKIEFKEPKNIRESNVENPDQVEEDRIPFWALPENRLDSQRRPVTHPDHDPTTLFIPEEELAKLTPSLSQYWQIKRNHFDKIVLFKLGKFYELFYNDALVCVRLLGIKMMGKKMHAGFPEKTLSKFASELLRHGLKCVVVEQMETPKQTEERIAREKPKKNEKITLRSVTQIMTPGTYQDLDHSDYNSKYLWVFQTLESPESYSLLIIEASSFQMRLLVQKNDSNLQFLKTALLQLQPDELVLRKNFVDPVVMKMFQTAFFQPHMTFLSDSQNGVYWSGFRLEDKLEEISKENLELWKQLNACLNCSEDGNFYKENLNALMEYYRELYLFDKLKMIGKVEILSPENFKGSSMYIDSQALVHLNIIGESNKGEESRDDNSLFAFISCTSNKASRRMLKRWLAHPSLDLEVINNRLDAIEDLETVSPLRENFMSTLKGLVDLERMAQRLFTYAVKHNPNIQYFENVSETRLKELRTFLDQIKVAMGACANLLRNNTFKSERLNKLLSSQDKGGLLPNISGIISEFKDKIIWEKDNIPTPAVGLDQEYDQLRTEGQKILKKLEEVLEQNKKRFDSQKISFTHTKARYELEVPEEVIKKKGKPSGFEFSSKRQGFSRFIIPETKKLVKDLDSLEVKMKDALAAFVKYVFNLFLSFRATWTQAIEAITEVDALCALSVCSHSQRFPMARPIVYPFSETPFIQGKGLVHPILAQKISDFRENDIEMGVGESNQFLFLTGPNMGGKSTILRQVCLSAILAQMGCFVPGKELRMSLVDRVFTRLGAADRLIEDKSTFFIEMEETANILKEGTQHSLAMIDELGRGTSTFDGVAICHGFIQEMISRIKCRTMFATHYHILVESCQKLPITFCYMDIFFDTETNQVILLHKLVSGIVRESQGINTAKTAGVDPETLQIASEKAKEFEFSMKFANMTSINKEFSEKLNWILETIGANGRTQQIIEALNFLKILE